MALLDSEGFGFSAAAADYNSYGVLVIPTGTGVTINTGGPLGDNFLAITNASSNNSNIARMLPSPVSTFFWGARVRYSTIGGQLIFRDGSGTEQFHLDVSSTGTITASRAGVTLGTATNALPVTGVTWAYLECGAAISTSAGTVTVKVNGTIVLAVTGVSNQNATGNLVASWVFGKLGNAIACDAAIMHHYFCDNTGVAPWNTFMGDVRVQTLLPTANDVVQFAPIGLAANWQNASQVPPAPGADYNQDATVGDQDTFACGPMSTSLTSVFGVTVKALALKSDAGGRSLQTVLKSGATTSLGASTGLSVSTSQLKTVYQTDPNTSAQWLRANVNVAKPGYKVSA